MAKEGASKGVKGKFLPGTIQEYIDRLPTGMRENVVESLNHTAIAWVSAPKTAAEAKARPYGRFYSLSNGFLLVLLIVAPAVALALLGNVIPSSLKPDFMKSDAEKAEEAVDEAVESGEMTEDEGKATKEILKNLKKQGAWF